MFKVKPKKITTTISQSTLGLRPPVVKEYTAEVLEGIIQNNEEFKINVAGERPKNKILVNIYSIVDNDINNLNLEEIRTIDEFEFTQLGMSEKDIRGVYGGLQYGSAKEQKAIVEKLVKSFGFELE